MVNRKNLVAVGSDASETTAAAPVEASYSTPVEDQPVDEEWYEEEPAARRFGWILPTLAVLAVVGWTLFFGWVHQRTLLAGASPRQWSEWIADWSMPVMLVVGLWLLLMRNSRREASRFADAAQALSRESSLLETRLVTVNRELSLARDFIAAQARDLDSLGRVASERLSQHAAALQGLIHDNGEQVETIGRVSTTARENMDRLRDDLPVISNAARDMTSQLGQIGNIAQGQLGELVAGFNRLNEFGEASSRQVSVLRTRVDESIATFEQQLRHMEEFSARRFDDLAERSAAFRADLDGREVEAFAAVRRRAEALDEELALRQAELQQQEEQALAALQQRLTQLRDEGTTLASGLRDGEADAAARWSEAIAGLQARMIEAIRQIADIDNRALENARQRLTGLSTEAQRVDAAMTERLELFESTLQQRSDAASARETAALAELEARLARIDTEVVERQQEHLSHVSGLAERGDALAARLRELSGEMDRIVAQGREAGSGMEQSVGLLTGKLGETREVIEESRHNVIQLTDDSVRLLELIRSSADHGSKDLPRALSEAENRLAAFRTDAEALCQLVDLASESGARLAQQVQKARGEGAGAASEMELLEQRMADLATRSAELAAQSRADMAEAIATLESAATETLSRLRDDQAGEVRALAEKIGADSSEAIVASLQAHTSEAIEDLRQAAEAAGSGSREMAAQLRDQLGKVNELAGNLERRVAHARAKAQEQVDNDFSRRMALITESLNSSAIDLTKAFDNDVADTAWASYLRGDRGIFTRRAVRLLDNQDARRVSDIYDEDQAFRETVNRYIHDFEAMLRSILSTRDGQALAVTLLSSDVGKLYVVLAQAIERLRD
ncbi:MAG: ATPase [Croceibacterium sp.]